MKITREEIANVLMNAKDHEEWLSPIPKSIGFAPRKHERGSAG